MVSERPCRGKTLFCSCIKNQWNHVWDYVSPQYLESTYTLLVSTCTVVRKKNQQHCITTIQYNHDGIIGKRNCDSGSGNHNNKNTNNRENKVLTKISTKLLLDASAFILCCTIIGTAACCVAMWAWTRQSEFVLVWLSFWKTFFSLLSTLMIYKI
jgi:hypothetical protein